MSISFAALQPQRGLQRLGLSFGQGALLCRRGLHTSSVVGSSQRRAPRMYRYVQDVHGQLFLHDTVPKNLTSCFKNAQFLDFFIARLRPNPASAIETRTLTISVDDEDAYRGQEDAEEDWTLDDGLAEDEACRRADARGYHWVSPCQGELNFVRCHGSPVVFRDLVKDDSGEGLGGDKLRWAGGYHEPFQPHRLMVDAATGYVYHPSPTPPLRSAQRKMSEGREKNPFGDYSLLASALVLERLASSLELDPDAFEHGKGGSIEWRGKRYEMGVL